MLHRASFLHAPAPLYIEELIPDASDSPCLVLVSGGAHTGACYLTTPDGRPGWAYNFLQLGYHVVIPDWPGVGRSGVVASDQMNGEFVCSALGALLQHLARPVYLLVHSMSGPYGIRLLETHGGLIRALIAVAPGGPGNAQPESAVLMESETELEIQGVALRWRIPKSGVLLPSEGLVQDKLLGSSSRFPRAALDAYRASLVPIPVRLVYERQNVGGTQIRIADTSGFRGKRILVVTGSHDTDHSRAVDGSTVAWLAEQGADVTFQFLPDIGIEGNGHMLMLEDNSEQIASLIATYLGGTN